MAGVGGVVEERLHDRGGPRQVGPGLEQWDERKCLGRAPHPDTDHTNRPSPARPGYPHAPGHADDIRAERVGAVQGDGPVEDAQQRQGFRCLLARPSNSLRSGAGTANC